MANLTISIGDDALKKARLRAVAEGTSVNAILKDYLESYAGLKSAQNQSLVQIVNLSRQCQSRRGSIRWNRDELHERH